MKKSIVFLSILATSSLFSENRLFDCTKIFEERKSELLLELERINDREQALYDLKEATNRLLKKKKEKLDKQEAEINRKLKLIEEKEQNIKNMIAENRKVLEEIKKIKLDKVSTTYSKMKPKSAAAILAELDPKIAVNVLLKIKPKTLSKIFAKMDPVKASELTRLLAETKENNGSI